MIQILIDTATRQAQVGLIHTGALRTRRLDTGQRQNRDLTVKLRELLEELAVTPRQVTGIVVALGPGSFTGLRVGVIAAKMWAYVHAVPLIAVPSFPALAEAISPEIGTVDIVSDGLQGLVYTQRFSVSENVWQATTPLALMPQEEWLISRTPGLAFAGPMAQTLAGLDPTAQTFAMPESDAALAALHRVSQRTPALTQAELFALEPLYLRASSAEEQAKKRQAQG